MPRLSRILVACGLLVTGAQICEAQAHLAPPVGVAKAGFSDSVAIGQPDTFLGPDKVKHFMMSAFIEAIGFSSLQAAGASRRVSLGAATTVTLGIGIAREIHDRRTKGLFSIGDLTWDTLGTAAALLVISHSQR